MSPGPALLLYCAQSCFFLESSPTDPESRVRRHWPWLCATPRPTPRTIGCRRRRAWVRPRVRVCTTTNEIFVRVAPPCPASVKLHEGAGETTAVHERSDSNSPPDSRPCQTVDCSRYHRWCVHRLALIYRISGSLQQSTCR